MCLSDERAKAILRDKWPARTKTWPIPGYAGYWVRACPSPSPMPFIHAAGGSALTTNPDGMYVFAHVLRGFVDIIAIEVCCNNQNCNDKRSRYTPTSGNDQLTLPVDWLNSELTVQRGAVKKYWEASRWFEHRPQSDVTLTIRHRRALFVLTDTDYARFGNNALPAGHEYFCRHRDLAQITQQGMRAFIKGMALMQHFRSRPADAGQQA